MSTGMLQSGLTAAYGGATWSPRVADRDDFVAAWGDWGVSSECGTLRAVLLRRPGPELDQIADYERGADARAARSRPRPRPARRARRRLRVARRRGSSASSEADLDKPNALFCRDLMLMTPAGAIITPPGLHGARGRGTLRRRGAGPPRRADPDVGPRRPAHSRGRMSPGSTSDLCFLAEGLRTNRAGADQVERALREIGRVEVIRVQLPYGAMHLDGLLNFADRDLAVIWPRRTPFPVWRTLHERGFRFIEVEDEVEAQECLPMNFVALAPGKILMPTRRRAPAGPATTRPASRRSRSRSTN